MLFAFVLIVGALFLLQQRWLMRRQLALADKLKTDIMSIPILGHSYKFLGTDEDRMNTLHEFGRDSLKAGGISKALHLNHVFICVADPIVAEAILTQSLEKHDLMKIMDFVIGSASLIAPVPIWRHRRKINTPVFSPKNLQKCIPTFYEHSFAMAAAMEEKVNKGTFSLWDYTVVHSMNTIFEIIMGEKINFRENEFLTAMDELWATGAYRMLQPWLKNQFLFKLMPSYGTMSNHKRTVYDFIKRVIREKRDKHNELNLAGIKNPDKMMSFLDYQLGETKESQKYNEQELVEEGLMLMAGYDTTATTIGYVTLLLCRHQEIQDKVYKELQSVFGDSDRAITYEDMCYLTYLEAVIKETLRLYPIVTVVARHIDKDITLPSGLTLVKDCGAMVNLWAIHRNPQYWGEDAEQFRPERFFDAPPKHPAAFMPFSFGPRGCTGYRFAIMFLKCMLSTMLRRYRVLAPPHVAPGEPLRTKFQMVSRHADNFEIQIQLRT